MLASKRVALLLDEALDDVGRTGMIFEGYGVDHLHAKLFPMHGTGRNSEFKPIASSVDKYFDSSKVIFRPMTINAKTMMSWLTLPPKLGLR